MVLTPDQKRGLLFFAVSPWVLLGMGLALNWSYFRVLWEDEYAWEVCCYLLVEHTAAVLIAFVGCLALNHTYPPEGAAARKRSLLNFLIFLFLVAATIPVYIGILGLPAYVQLQKNTAPFGP